MISYKIEISLDRDCCGQAECPNLGKYFACLMAYNSTQPGLWYNTGLTTWQETPEKACEYILSEAKKYIS